MDGGRRRLKTRFLTAMAVALLFPPGARAAENLKFEPDFNLFSVHQDVQLGKEGAAQVDSTLPLLTDPQAVRYLNDLGRRLASLAPNNNAAYVWTFKIIDSPDVNAFAFPGGYIYVNRGAIAAAADEGQLAGVIAHECGHVVMRHGTHEASQALLAHPLAILESIFGPTGSLTDQLEEMGLGVKAVLLKNSRRAESQADEVAAYVLYRAGYDPRSMAQFFELVEQQYSEGATGFFSDHPDPEDRIEAVARELPQLGPPKTWTGDTAEFRNVKQRLLSVAAPPAAEPPAPASVIYSAPPPAPSSRFTRYEGNGFSIAYPDNWQPQQSEDALSFFPPGGMVEVPDWGSTQAYGASLSRFQPQNASPGRWELVEATQELLDMMRTSNPGLRVMEQRGIKLKGRAALSTLLEADSPLAGQKERDLLVTTRQNDSVFSLILIAPESSFPSYRPTFDAMVKSLQVQ
jgi:Zn-dependent protease with chaperone function